MSRTNNALHAFVSQKFNLRPLDSVDKSNRLFVNLARAVSLIGVTSSISFIVTKQWMMAVFISAFVGGLSEADGRCGISHIGTIAPIKILNNRLWFRCALSYSVSGMVTSILMGVTIAALGMLLHIKSSYVVLWLVPIVTIVILLREIGLLKYPLPQCNRQTLKNWMNEFSWPTATGMWGAHIGLAVTTVIKHGALYSLILLALVLDLTSGALILACFWLGRICPMWIASFFTRSDIDGGVLISFIENNSVAFRTLGVGTNLGLLVAGISLAVVYMV